MTDRSRLEPKAERPTDSPPFLRPLWLLHGVNSHGEWYEGVRGALEANFSIEQSEYSGYRWNELLGPMAVVAEPVVVGLGLLAIVCSLVALSGWPLLLTIVAVLLCTAWLAVFATYWRFGRATEKAAGSVSQRGSLAAADVIAHSNGTRVLGSLTERGLVRPHRIVLVGSVLPNRYEFSSPHARYAPLAVYNWVGKKDSVVLLVGYVNLFFRWFIPHQLRPMLGTAGREGFLATDRVRKHLLTRGERCHACANDANPPADAASVFVHEVVDPHGTHSSAFLRTDICLDEWLPFLLGYDPHAYRVLREHAAELILMGSPLEAIVRPECYEMARALLSLPAPDGKQNVDAWISSWLDANAARSSRAPVSEEELARISWHFAYHLSIAASSIGSRLIDSQTRRCIDPSAALKRAMTSWRRSGNGMVS